MSYEEPRGDRAVSRPMLTLFAPGPLRARSFQGRAEISASGRRFTDEQWTELFARHDQYMV